jgi:membrane-associated phospholipid phosphatase
MPVDVEEFASEPARPRVSTSRAVARLSALALVCVVLLGALGLFSVRTADGQRIDDGALRGRVVQHTQARADSQRLLRTITEGSLALLGGALIVVALLRGRWYLALAVGAMILGANLTTQAMKSGIERPDLIGAAYDATVNTWPSGHTTVAASLAAALVMVVPARARPLAATVGAFYAAAIAVGVMAAGWHRPSDAAGAFAVVGAWAFGVSALLVAGRGAGRPARRSSTPALAHGAIVVLSVAFAALAVTTTVNQAAGVHLVRLGAAYLVAAGTLVVVAVVFAGSLVLGLRGVSLDARQWRA